MSSKTVVSQLRADKLAAAAAASAAVEEATAQEQLVRRDTAALKSQSQVEWFPIRFGIRPVCCTYSRLFPLVYRFTTTIDDMFFTGLRFDGFMM